MTLTTKKKRAIAALLSTRTMEEAADRVGVSRKTLQDRWMKNPEFRHALKKAQDEMLSEATRALVRLQMGAINKLEDIMTDGKQGDSQKRLAAQALLDNVYKGVELRDVVERLERLEESRLQ